jgi:hypothetical protein
MAVRKRMHYFAPQSNPSYPIMASKHLEVILETLPAADIPALCERLQKRGLQAHPMKVGVLLSGEIEDIRPLLPALMGAEQSDLPVPDELKDAVRTIYLVKPRSLY